MQMAKDSRLSMGRAAALVGVHAATIWRWSLHGVRGRRLTTFLVGGRRYVTIEALNSFLNNVAAVPPQADPTTRAERAGAELDRMLGISDQSVASPQRLTPKQC